ncbi:MAG: drug exporter-like proteinr of the superfamily [Solirubrobacterales bacterium]|nr:drug exporter-like proteinr of the superfamily [Solirubrobacterales bacterium]
MQELMLRLDRVLARRRWLVLGAWVAALAVALPFAMKQSEHLTGGGFGVPGSQSQAVADLTSDDFGGAGHARLGAVVIARPGAPAADVRAAIQRVRDVAGATPHVSLGGELVRRGGTTIIPLATTVDDVRSTDVAKDLRTRLGIGGAASSGAVTTHLIGQGALWAGLQEVSKKSLADAEGIGFPIVLLILLAVFGSLAAATLPLALGLVSVLITGGAIYGLSRVTDMSVFVTNMASMVGIGVAVDYSLFVLARYREEVHAGLSPARARGIAMATSGVAVTFSGLTVMASLAGLFLIHSTSLQSMALGAIVVVAVAVLASATLLPVLIRFYGARAYTRGRVFSLLHLAGRNARRRRGSTNPDAPARPGFWEAWTARVSRRPAVSAALAGAVLLALALPALGLKTQDGALRQFAKGDETRVGFEAAAKVTGPGASSALKVIVPATQARAARATLGADPEIANVAAPVASNDGRSVLLMATPRHDGESATAKAAVERLRAELPAAKIGGNAAGLHDFDDLVSGSMWKIILFVLGLSFVVLLVLLRSVVLPLKAVVMNLLSVGAAFGVLKLVFGTVDTITPPLILAVVFGLSMDYEVFLLTRIRERYAATGDTRRAVSEGLASSARTITSAALIMAAVFMVFVFTGVPSIRQLGLGNAVAIVVDATLVRLVLVPAAMELLGKWNWWLPRPLARILPNSSFEEAPVSA